MKRYGDNNQMGIAGKIAVVTGAATGIGRRTAQVFAREGANVIVADRDAANGARDGASHQGGRGRGGLRHVRRLQREGRRDARRQCVQRYGSLDFAYNNAGIGPDGVRIPIVPIMELPAEAWLAHLDVNLTGVFYCLKYEMRQMMKQGKGAIVICSSLQALQSVPGFAGYGSTKTGLLGLTQGRRARGRPVEYPGQLHLPGLHRAHQPLGQLPRQHPGRAGAPDVGHPSGPPGDPRRHGRDGSLALCSDAASWIDRAGRAGGWGYGVGPGPLGAVRASCYNAVRYRPRQLVPPRRQKRKAKPCTHGRPTRQPRQSVTDIARSQGASLTESKCHRPPLLLEVDVFVVEGGEQYAETGQRSKRSKRSPPTSRPPISTTSSTIAA